MAVYIRLGFFKGVDEGKFEFTSPLHLVGVQINLGENDQRLSRSRWDNKIDYKNWFNHSEYG